MKIKNWHSNSLTMYSYIHHLDNPPMQYS
ncbi:hypothetical protein A3Q56_07850 [Intoshia linei]|uniref:Uncharacterized protein n=1 Tax=Intoshia linei TaxID=1819745 RepID=A0A177AR41_9BILA|nr:hypothetical protein A3Q56_07850 [Intoshia linei]